MDAATEAGVGFAASLDGGYILPGFLPAFDAAASLVKLLELLALSGPRLSDVVDALPRAAPGPARRSSPRGSRRARSCAALVELAKDRERRAGRRGQGPPRRRLGAGRCPTPRSPSPTSGPRAATDADARRLAQEYARRIRQMLR